MTAATTNRRLLLAVAAVGVIAGLVGIGTSIAGVDDDRDPGGAADTTTTAPPEGAAPPAPEAPATEAPVTEAPAPPEEPTEEEEAAIEARLEAEAAVDRTQAEQIALGQVAGTVDRARISAEGWEVRVDTADGHVDVLVDATTGAVLEVDD